MEIHLDNYLPEYPSFVSGIRRAPDRGYSLTPAQTETALMNALRYIPVELHEKLAPEFMEELLTRGRIYGYRYRPQGDLKAKPISEYKGKCIEGKAFQVMIDNNLCFDIALYPYELVTYGETGQVCQNWMQYRLIKKYLEELTEELEIFLGITPEDMDEAVPRTRRTVNREKVTDHHAILPTRSMLQADLEALPKGEQNVLKLIIARTLMAVSKPFRYLETLLTTECAGEEFTAKGKEVLEEGWKAVERKVLADILNRKQELTALPNAAENECGILNAELKEGQTSPPKHFTEDTLLHAMETASADSMPEGVERQGIGTPATRAATIEKLVQKGFLERKGNKKTKVLLPTDKGKALITVMPEGIQSPEMTADWETKLLRIERGEMEPETFMTEIKETISSLVKTTEAAKGANAFMKNKIIGVCPNCGANVVEREKGWFCESNPCRFVLWKDNAYFKRLGKRLDAHVADKLLRDGRVRLKDCKSAKGKNYNATVLLSCEADGRSKFSLEFEGGC